MVDEKTTIACSTLGYSGNLIWKLLVILHYSIFASCHCVRMYYGMILVGMEVDAALEDFVADVKLRVYQLQSCWLQLKKNGRNEYADKSCEVCVVVLGFQVASIPIVMLWAKH
eukprot:1402577-Amphidinium_carterae.1